MSVERMFGKHGDWHGSISKQRQAGKQANKQASNQASNQSIKQPSKQASRKAQASPGEKGKLPPCQQDLRECVIGRVASAQEPKEHNRHGNSA